MDIYKEKLIEEGTLRLNEIEEKIRQMSQPEAYKEYMIDQKAHAVRKQVEILIRYPELSEKSTVFGMAKELVASGTFRV